MLEKMMETMLPTLIKAMATSPEARAKLDILIERATEIRDRFANIEKSSAETNARLDKIEAILNDPNASKSSAEIVPLFTANERKEIA